MHRWQSILRVSIAVLAVGTLAWSQSSYTAAVRGVITDASGGALPGAKVSVVEAERNVTHTATSDEAGRYSMTALPPGRYTLTVEAQGFKKYTKSAFSLVVQQQATFDISLSVGELTTVVEVEGESSLLNTTNSSLGQVVENRYMVALPNIGRSPLAFLNLTPG